MALEEIDARCSGCLHEFRTRPKRSFMGFQKLKCPSCGKKVLYPLTTGYRVIYWVLLALMGYSLSLNWSAGRVASPGLIGFAIMAALVNDLRMRRELASPAAPNASNENSV
jgi:DNA-directed RNA polymerase subunit RPC12/RpoP